MENFITWFFYYTIYAFLGYICEVVYVAIITKKITNRGYLFGPMVPIYGYGAILVIGLLWSFRNNPFLIILLGGLLTSGLEYLTSFFMELIFHMRWWDYSDKFMNLNGRICLRNSLLFIGLVVLVIYGLHPVIINLVSYVMNIKALYLSLFIIILVLQIIDTIISTIKHVKLSRIIIKLEELYDKAKDATIENINKTKEFISNSKIYKKLSNLNMHYPSFKLRSKITELKGNMPNLIEKIKSRFGGDKDE